MPQKLRKCHVENGVLVKDRFVDDPAGGGPVVALTVGGTEVRLRVHLFNPTAVFNPGLPWREGAGGKAQMHIQYRKLKLAPPDSASAGWESPLCYEVQMLVVVEPPAKKPAPIYRDWCRRFFPGGLPSLNKRRR